MPRGQPHGKPQSVPSLEERKKPGLSVTLPFPRSIDTCQSCGILAEPIGGGLTRGLEKWTECDEWDKPRGVVVILCHACAKRLIDPHPRLYISAQWNQPHAGTMSVCVGCVFRGTPADPLSCANPAASRNGGPGVKMLYARAPQWCHLNYGGGRGRTTYLYTEPPASCDGRVDAVALEGQASCMLCRRPIDTADPEGHGLGECVTVCEVCQGAGDDRAGEPCAACQGLGGTRDDARRDYDAAPTA